MNLTDLPDEIRDQLRGLVHMAQDAVIDTLGWLAEPTWTMVPDSVIRLTHRLPDGAEFVDRGSPPPSTGCGRSVSSRPGSPTPSPAV